MTNLQLVLVLLVLAFLVVATSEYLGFPMTYGQALAALITLKAIALFLVPEKPPMVLVKSRTEIEEDAE